MSPVFRAVSHVAFTPWKASQRPEIWTKLILYILVFYNIFSWLLPSDGFQLFIFMCRVYCVTVKTKNRGVHQEGVDCIAVSTPPLAL